MKDGQNSGYDTHDFVHCIHFGSNTRVVRAIIFLSSHTFIVSNYVPLICSNNSPLLLPESYYCTHYINLWLCKRKIVGWKGHVEHVSMQLWHGIKAYRRLITFCNQTNIYLFRPDCIPLPSPHCGSLSHLHWTNLYNGQTLWPNMC